MASKEALVQLIRRGRSDLLSLSGADLSEADLRGADLSEADLSGAYLSGAYLPEADLFGANFSGADLSEADLRGADLFEANFSGANFSRAHLSRANLFRANLRRIDLSGADLRGARLSGAHLRGAYLRGADLRKADLSGTDLKGAYLSEADLSGADLRGANFRGALYNSSTVWPEGFEYKASGAVGLGADFYEEANQPLYLKMPLAFEFPDSPPNMNMSHILNDIEMFNNTMFRRGFIVEVQSISYGSPFEIFSQLLARRAGASLIILNQFREWFGLPRLVVDPEGLLEPAENPLEEGQAIVPMEPLPHLGRVQILPSNDFFAPQRMQNTKALIEAAEAERFKLQQEDITDPKGASWKRAKRIKHLTEQISLYRADYDTQYTLLEPPPWWPVERGDSSLQPWLDNNGVLFATLRRIALQLPERDQRRIQTVSSESIPGMERAFQEQMVEGLLAQVIAHPAPLEKKLKSQDNLARLRAFLSDTNIDAKHKLIVSIPIVPFMVKYQGELALEGKRPLTGLLHVFEGGGKSDD